MGTCNSGGWSLPEGNFLTTSAAMFLMGTSWGEKNVTPHEQYITGWWFQPL